MIMLYILLLFFAALAIFWGIDRSLANKKIWVRNPKLRLNYSFKNWRVVDYLALSILLSIALLAFLALCVALGGKLNPIVPRSIFAVICISTVFFSISHYNLAKWYSKFSNLFKIAATLATLVITLIANALGDASILSYTHVDPSQFPVAQKAFILIGIVGLWIYVAMYASLPAYLIIAIQIFKPGYLEWRHKRKRTYANSCTRLPNHFARDLNLALAAFAGACYTITILLSIISSVGSNTINITLKELLVFSSFHLPAKACGIRDRSDSSVALIGNDEAVLAIPDIELGFTFKKIKCELQPVEVLRRTAEPFKTFYKPIKPINFIETQSHACNIPRCLMLKSTQGYNICI
ncbi:hypothetical protein HNO91_20350 [Pseudomonas corrugata]|uniref:Uncharacterized protein n=1 Tax=Pseudomonas corrugata TaxID=47879 RepID=A0A7Y5Z8J1_9PSED|nr:hypothetical protein [Pseudomonas corrugata]NUT88786.1 hypothetical protein [Pseudomonas corrugata]